MAITSLILLPTYMIRGSDILLSVELMDDYLVRQITFTIPQSIIYSASNN